MLSAVLRAMDFMTCVMIKVRAPRGSPKKSASNAFDRSPGRTVVL